MFVFLRFSFPNRWSFPPSFFNPFKHGFREGCHLPVLQSGVDPFSDWCEFRVFPVNISVKFSSSMMDKYE